MSRLWQSLSGLVRRRIEAALCLDQLISTTRETARQGLGEMDRVSEGVLRQAARGHSRFSLFHLFLNLTLAHVSISPMLWYLFFPKLALSSWNLPHSEIPQPWIQPQMVSTPATVAQVRQVRNNSSSGTALGPRVRPPRPPRPGFVESWDRSPRLPHPPAMASRPNGYTQDCPSDGTRLFQKTAKHWNSRCPRFNATEINHL